eukprot:COSAG02_NODE_208_length_29027_cov_27.870230_18_plen_71_part_00
MKAHRGRQSRRPSRCQIANPLALELVCLLEASQSIMPAASTTSSTRSITEADIRMFRDDGYCICPNFFSE